MSTPVLSNPAARRLFLDRHGLAEAPTGAVSGAGLLDLIKRLGFVQVDSINTVARAHDLILWSRRHGYRPKTLRLLNDRDRAVFEHWTHDAAMIPTAFLPYWHMRFDRDRARLRQRYRTWQGPAFEAKLDEVLGHIAAHGPVASGDMNGAVGDARATKSTGWWDWHPSKTALEYLWRTGALAVTRREGFVKIYDLAERVHSPVQADPAAATPSEAETIDWACSGALDRLGFATSGEIAAFWATVTADEARRWCHDALARGDIIDIAVECADGQHRRCFARPDVIAQAGDAPAAPSRLRVLSPFDPALRDRKRAERVFGFHYRIEVFVPEAQRRFGYYVFPVLEGDRLVGRLDARARRAEGCLQVAAFWPEPGIRMGKARIGRLEAQLDRLARFSGCERCAFEPGWLRE